MSDPILDAAARTTVGRLVYDALPPFDFGRLVADLDAALAGAGPRSLRWDHDDVAVLDVGASRVALGQVSGIGRRGAAAVSVAVGHVPDGEGDDRLAARRDTLAAMIAERIAARFPPREVIWTECAAAAGADLFDALAEELGAALDARDAEPAAEPDAAATPGDVEDVAPPPRRPARARRLLGEPVDPGRMMARLEAALAARGAADAANDAPDLPRPDLSGLRSVREALYAGPEDLEERPSAAMRLAAHAINATLLVVALPVGAAMMTHSLARGANLHASARMLALCGIGVGALQAVGGVGGLLSLVPSI